MIKLGVAVFPLLQRRILSYLWEIYLPCLILVVNVLVVVANSIVIV